MKKNNFVILKFGGSVITDKEKPFKARVNVIDRLAREVSEYEGKMIIIHGGGSFGHPVAHKYKIKDGYKEKQQLIGFAKTHSAMQKLNIIVTQRLIKYGVPAVSVPPVSTTLSQDGIIKKLECETIERMLNIGLIPVLYGDTVLDMNMGFTIVSGDQIASHLSIKFNAAQLIFVLDVDGLFTDDPRKTPEKAKLIEEIDVQSLKKTTNIFERKGGIDVTGGIAEKVKWIIPVAEKGIPVILLNGNVPGRLKKALTGVKTVGTYIHG